jgi:hypothetical protein
MKDRQAQLEQNIVAENLAGFFKKIEPYSKLILAGVVALVVLVIAVGLYTSGETQKRSDATLMLLTNNPAVVDEFPGTAAAAWSQLFQGNNDLADGIRLLYQDRDEAETKLSQAIEMFTDASQSSKDGLVISRSNFGIAVALESLGKIDEAIEAYKKTVAANESEQMVEVAQEKIDRLSDADSTQFLAWFSEQDFSPADPSLPPELPGSGALPDLPDLPMDELEFPGMNLSDKMKATETPSKPIEGGMELPDGTEVENPAAGSDADPASGEEADKAVPKTETSSGDAVEAPAAEETAAEPADATSAEPADATAAEKTAAEKTADKPE